MIKKNNSLTQKLIVLLIVFILIFGIMYAINPNMFDIKENYNRLTNMSNTNYSKYI
jgi:preprotein translocase subunit YajC